MALTSCSASEADWLVASRIPADRLITLGPEGFAAYARLRFIPDPTSPAQAESDVELDRDHLSDIDQAHRVLASLSAFTTTPEKCFFAAWTGGAEERSTSAGGGVFALPHRRYRLMRGPLTEIDSWEGPDAPAFVWPQDRAWCFTCDVDPHWAGIGASERAIRHLVADPVLDIVATRPDQPWPAYR